METLYRKVAVSVRLPKEEKWYHVIDEDGNVDLCPFRRGGFSATDTIGQKEVKFWIESIPDPTAQLNVKSLEEIRDTVAKNRGYENWETLNGSDLYDSDIDEVAKKYAESKTAQLKADKEELLEALENLTEYGSTGEDAVEMKREIESLIQKHKQ